MRNQASLWSKAAEFFPVDRVFASSKQLRFAVNCFLINGQSSVNFHASLFTVTMGRQRIPIVDAFMMTKSRGINMTNYPKTHLCVHSTSSGHTIKDMSRIKTLLGGNRIFSTKYVEPKQCMNIPVHYPLLHNGMLYSIVGLSV